ncbi:MAG: FtsQ-type POTRA domain-containing protein [Myxococcales bacterium]|nr:FtsQ-type POTRA domain-containing protein [Myxococcales bacterium]
MNRPVNRRNSRNHRPKPQRFGLMAWFVRVRHWLTTRRHHPTEVPSQGHDDGLVIQPRVVLARIGAAVTAGVCIALVIGVAMSMDSYSSRTKQFKVRAFEVDGALRTEESELIAASGLAVGAPLLGVSTQQVKVAIEELPWISHAIVRIEMPGTVHVRVSEHVPAAMVVDGAVVLVDAGGNFIKSLDLGASHELPVITGISLKMLRWDGKAKDAAGRAKAAHRALARRTLTRLLSVVLRWRETSVAQRFPIGEVSWDPVLGVTVMSARDASEVRIGHRDGEDLSRVIAQLDRLLGALEKRGERLRYVLMDDASRPERAIVDAVAASKWAALPPLRRAAGPSSPRPPAPQNNKSAKRKSAKGEKNRAGRRPVGHAGQKP